MHTHDDARTRNLGTADGQNPVNQQHQLERISEIQDEILSFTWSQVGDQVSEFFVQGKIADDESGRTERVEGNLMYMVLGDRIVDDAALLDDEAFVENARYVTPRIVEMHDLLVDLQGKSPARFRWAVDTKSKQVDSQWTYYDDLTDSEKRENWWEYCDADFAWRDQLQAELDARNSHAS